MTIVSDGILTTAGMKVLSNLISESAPTNWALYLSYGAGVSGEQAAFGAVSTGGYYSLRGTAATTLLAQSFQIDDDASISSVQLALKKQCLWDVYRWLCPSGNLWVEIHSSKTGTSGTKNASTNIVGTASDNVATGDINQSYEWVEFTFSGTKPPLSADTAYYVVLYGSFAVDPDKYVNWSNKSAGGYADGDAYTINGSMTWSSALTSDYSFKIYGSGEVTVSKHDTELASEIDRALGTVVDTSSRIYLAKTFTVGDACTIMEVGVHDALSGGNLIFHGNAGNDNKIEAAADSEYPLIVALEIEQG